MRLDGSLHVVGPRVLLTSALMFTPNTLSSGCSHGSVICSACIAYGYILHKSALQLQEKNTKRKRKKEKKEYLWSFRIIKKLLCFVFFFFKPSLRFCLSLCELPSRSGPEPCCHYCCHHRGNLQRHISFLSVGHGRCCPMPSPKGLVPHSGMTTRWDKGHMHFC